MPDDAIKGPFDTAPSAVTDSGMTTKVIVRFLAVLMFLGALVGAYLKGRSDVLEIEFKECQGNMVMLTYWESNQTPELKEYVKARYYYLANKVSKDFVSPPRDFGAVSTNAETLAVFKGPSSGQMEYLNFLQRFNLSKSPP